MSIRTALGRLPFGRSARGAASSATTVFWLTLPTTNDQARWSAEATEVANRLSRFFARGPVGTNLFMLSDLAFVSDVADWSQVVVSWHGPGPHRVTALQAYLLLASGYTITTTVE